MRVIPLLRKISSIISMVNYFYINLKDNCQLRNYLSMGSFWLYCLLRREWETSSTAQEKTLQGQII